MAQPKDTRVQAPTNDDRAIERPHNNGHDDIARRAYDRFRARSEEHGHDQEDWFEAERELANEHSRATE